MTDMQNSTTSPAAQTPAASVQPPLGAKKKGIAFIVLVIVLAFVGIGVAGYFIATSTGNFLGQSNAGRIKAALEKTLDQQIAVVSAKVDLTGALASPDGTAEDMNLQISFNGNVSSASDEAQVGQGSVQIEGQLGGSDVNIAAEYRRLPPRTYVLLGTQTVLEALPFDVSGLAGRWLYMEDPEEDEGEETIPLPLPVDLSCERDTAAVESYVESLDFSDVFSKIEKKGMIEVAEPDGDKETAQLYGLAMDTEKLSEIESRVAEIGGCDSVESSSDDLQLTSLDVAIGERSGLIRSIQATGIIDGEEQTTFSLQLIFSNFGETPKVLAPTDAVSLEDAMGELIFGDLFGDMMDENSMMFDKVMPEGSTETGEVSAEDFDAIMKELEDLAKEMEAQFGGTEQ